MSGRDFGHCDGGARLHQRGPNETKSAPSTESSTRVRYRLVDAVDGQLEWYNAAGSMNGDGRLGVGVGLLHEGVVDQGFGHALLRAARHEVQTPYGAIAEFQLDAARNRNRPAHCFIAAFDAECRGNVNGGYKMTFLVKPDLPIQDRTPILINQPKVGDAGFLRCSADRVLAGHLPRVVLGGLDATRRFRRGTSRGRGCGSRWPRLLRFLNR